MGERNSLTVLFKGIHYRIGKVFTRFMPSDDSSIFSREAMMFGAHRSTCFLMSSIATSIETC